MKVRPVCTEPEDALGPAFLDDRIAGDASLVGTLDRFVGSGHDAEELRADMARIAFLVGGSEARAAGGRR
jgi:hypothetical protein